MSFHVEKIEVKKKDLTSSEYCGIISQKGSIMSIKNEYYKIPK